MTYDYETTFITMNCRGSYTYIIIKANASMILMTGPAQTWGSALRVAEKCFCSN